MERLKAAVLTLCWGLSLLPVFRWWGITLGMAGLMFWTVVYVAAYAATAIAAFGATARTNHELVRDPVLLWLAIVVVVFIAHLLVPEIRIRGRAVKTSAFVSVLDFVVPIWVIVRAMLLLWTTVSARVVVLTAGPAVVATVLLSYMIAMPGESFAGELLPLTAEQTARRDRLEATVRRLAGDIGERNDGRFDQLRAAATYVDSMFTALGYAVLRQSYEFAGRQFDNLEVVIPGIEHPEQIVVVGGHYDTVEGTPGADDNASGTAAVLELGRMLRNERLPRTVRLVVFVNEEPPFFDSEWMGSWQYAARAVQLNENIVAMVALETLGFYQTEPKSQGYPPPFSFFYPNVGNFVAFVGNLPSRSLVRRSIAAFRRTANFPSEGVAALEAIPGIWWSDHAPFWRHGFKAIMITDTAPFRNPHYHQESDVPDRLDYDRMSRVVTGIADVVRELASTD